MENKAEKQKEQQKEQQNKFKLIPKAEKYIQYIIEMIIKIPRTEKYSIGTEYKKSMYEMLENILIISKIEKRETIKIFKQNRRNVKHPKNIFKNNEKQ